MNTHARTLIGIGVVAAALLSACASTQTAPAAKAPADSPHKSLLIIHDSARARGTPLTRAAVSEGSLWLYMEPQSGIAGGGEAVYESDEIDPGLAFNEVLLSWNADVPEGAGVRFDIHVRSAGDGAWSPWLYIGRAGSVPAPGPRLQSFDRGRVEIDFFNSDHDFDRIQYRVTAYRAGSSASASPVRIRRIALCCTAAVLDATAPPNLSRRPAPIALDVPFRSQKAEGALASRICSPTSLTMVLAFHGKVHPVAEVCRAAFDPDFDIYGNWPRNIQAAYELGGEGYLTRFPSWADVRAQFEAGRPVIISFAAQKGEITGAPYESTNGHLLVIRGFDSHGDVLVCDPAAADPAAGTKAYSRAELTNLWLVRNRGTSYLILGPRQR
jgi:hypothetical protein